MGETRRTDRRKENREPQNTHSSRRHRSTSKRRTTNNEQRLTRGLHRLYAAIVQNYFQPGTERLTNERACCDIDRREQRREHSAFALSPLSLLLVSAASRCLAFPTLVCDSFRVTRRMIRLSASLFSRQSRPLLQKRLAQHQQARFNSSSAQKKVSAALLHRAASPISG